MIPVISGHHVFPDPNVKTVIASCSYIIIVQESIREPGSSAELFEYLFLVDQIKLSGILKSRNLRIRFLAEVSAVSLLDWSLDPQIS